MTRRLSSLLLPVTGSFGVLLLATNFNPGVMRAVAADAASTASPAPFTLCRSKYALCTSAPCTPVAGKPEMVSCKCRVHDGYSAATAACQTAEQTSTGNLMSRYFPVTGYLAACSNSRDWAWCLDKPCEIDKNDPSKADCACSVVKNLGTYVIGTTKIGTSEYTKSTCTTGIISSATIQQIEQISDFIASQKQIPVPPLEILYSPSP
jgi:hypothetical protein